MVTATKKYKLRIAVIDDGINMNLFKKLRPTNKFIQCLQVNEQDCIKQYNNSNHHINHGTVCTSILSEALEERGLLSDIELISISVLDENKKNNIFMLCNAIVWCTEHEVDIISISIGVKNFITAHILIETVIKRKNIIIVAAGANDDVVTYPACLPSVIGVKASKEVLSHGCIYQDPVDGIDIQINMQVPKVLKMLAQEFCHSIPMTNSLIAPYVTAHIAELLFCDGKFNDIGTLKQSLVKHMCLEVINDRSGYLKDYSEDGMKNEVVTQLPLIAIEYNQHNMSTIKALAQILQQELIQREYNCACISDIISANCYEQNWLRLPEVDMLRWLNFYTHKLNSSIMLLIVKKDYLSFLDNSGVLDAIITVESTDYQSFVYRVENEMTIGFLQNIITWILALYETEDKAER